MLFLIVAHSNLIGQNDSQKQKQMDTTLSSLSKIEYTIFESDSMKSRIFKDDYKTIKITKSDIADCEALLREFINQYNIKGDRKLDSTKRYFKEVKHIEFIQLYQDQFHINLERYGRQYFILQAPNKHKIVFINCFCNPDEFDYKKDWIFVKDGGNCFFNLKIDLTDKKIIEFSENGVA